MIFKKLSAALVGIVMAVSFNANAGLIENGYMDPETGGYCSNCADLDTRDYMVFDTLSILNESILNSISFDISNYINNSSVLANTTDFLIEIWDVGFTTQTSVWNFNTTQLTSYTYNGSTTFTVDYNLGDFLISSGNYLIGISMDNGAFSTNPLVYTQGADGDGSAIQYDVSQSNYTFANNVEGDLPFRLTINTQSVPEPSTLAIFGLALMGLASRRFKKQ